MASKLHLFVIAFTCFALLIAPAAADEPSTNLTEEPSLSDVQANAETLGIKTIANIGKSFVNHTADTIEAEDAIYNDTHQITMKQLAPIGHVIANVAEFIVPKSTAGKVIGGTELSGVVAANIFNIYASNTLNAANGFAKTCVEAVARVYSLKESVLYKPLYDLYAGRLVEANTALESAKSTANIASKIATWANYIAGYGALLYYGYRYCDKSAELIQDAYVQHGVEFDHTLLNW